MPSIGELAFPTVSLILGTIAMIAAIIGNIQIRSLTLKLTKTQSILLALFGFILISVGVISFAQQTNINNSLSPLLTTNLNPSTNLAVTETLLPSSTNISSPTFDNDSLTYTPSAAVKETTTPIARSGFDNFTWMGETLSDKDFYSINEGLFFLSERGLVLSGRNHYDYVWVDRKLPKNFVAKVNFHAGGPNCSFAIGIGTGIDWGWSYLLNLTQENAAIKTTGDFGNGIEDKYINPVNFDHTIKDVNYIVFERYNSNLRIFLNNDDNAVFRFSKEYSNMMARLDDYDTLFFYGVGDDPCLVIVNKLLVTTTP